MTLRVSSLAVARGGVPLLSGVSFEVGPGAALILRGPNGVGKTTLLRTLAGLQPPISGTVEGASEAAYASHADGVKAQLSVEENLGFWAEIHGTPAPGEAVYAAFDLADLRDRMAGTLSAGQKRRLGLARLLVTGRPVWALDEPTVSLDRASVGLFAAAVEAHCAAGGAALIATHIDLGFAARELDLTAHKAAVPAGAADFDEAFL